MAFCKYCGKEIAEGAICSCPGAIHEANANNSFPKADTIPAESEPVNAESKPASSKPAYEGPSIRKVDTGINDRKPAADDGLKKFAALVGAVLFVFIIIVGNMASGSGYKGTVKKYFKSRYSKHGGKTYYSLTLPDAGIAELKDNDLWKELVEDYNDSVEDRMDDWDKKPEFRKISRVKDMKKSELKDAEKYFSSAAQVCEADIDEDDIEIRKGYEVIYKYRNTEGKNEKSTVYVVKIKGDGWKIMNQQGTSFYGLDK